MKQTSKILTSKLRKIVCAGFIISSSLFASPIMAAENANPYKESLEIEGNMVTLSDLFGDQLTNHLENPDKPILRSPKPGAMIKISSYKIANIAKANNIKWPAPDMSYRMTLKRLGVKVNASDIAPMIENQVMAHLSADNVNIRFNGLSRNLYIPTSRTLDEIQINDFSLRENSSNFSFTLSVPEGQDSYKSVRISGTAIAMIKVPVLSSTLLKGEVISKNHIQWKEVMQRTTSQRDIVITDREIMGMAARRTIRSNQLIRSSDLQRPQIVKKGQLINVELKTGMISIMMSAKAMQDGAMGDTVLIQNVRSKKTFEAIVAGHKQARIQPTAALKLASR